MKKKRVKAQKDRLPRVPVPKPTIVHKTKEEKRNNRQMEKVRIQREALEEWGRHTQR
jgi:hypothetical protein